ncbi:unnamed protein product, partial [Prunus brigantina]
LNHNPFARPFNFTSRNLQTTNDRSHQRSLKTTNPFARPSSKTTNDRSRFFISVSVSGFGFLQFSASQFLVLVLVFCISISGFGFLQFSASQFLVLVLVFCISISGFGFLQFSASQFLFLVLVLVFCISVSGSSTLFLPTQFLIWVAFTLQIGEVEGEGKNKNQIVIK